MQISAIIKITPHTKKKGVEIMLRQAKQLIDDWKFGIAGIATSWDYDNRATSNKEDVFPTCALNRKYGEYVGFKRDFQKQTDGNMMLEMYYITELSGDGIIIKMCSENGKVLYEITTKDGFYRFNGNKTDAPSVLGENSIRVDFDLEGQTAKFTVNGKTAGSYRLEKVSDVARLYLGTTGETEIKLNPVKTRLAVDYLAFESFMCTDSTLPDSFEVSGNIEMRTHNGANPQMNYNYAVIGGNSCAVRKFDKADHDIIAEGYIIMPDGSDGAKFAVTNGNNEIFGVVTKGGAFYTLDGTFLRKFTANVWQVIRFETENGKVLIRIDGKKCGTFDIAETAFDALKVEFAPGTDSEMYFADLYAEARIDYPDYCPEPKQVKHPEYEVGLNVCNMWREGHHFGWDRITYFKDNTPLIGPYDEGNPEVADWEIKFMTEHGITFQHFCWYCPDSMISFPLKRSRMDQALRDGFMNARYSDKMKFIIMWENNGYSNTNPDHFIEYVWKYWCEYLFTDPRYLKIDNKPLLSLWSFRFVEHWGGAQKAKEIIKFMNEDIKRYGCDGIILMATAGMSSYENLSEYCDLTYSYHFGKNGYSADYMIENIDEFNSKLEKGLVPYMQTVSVGFNSCPWHGADARSPLASLDDYEKVLRYIKGNSDSKAEKKWHDKLFMMSTWNEYGEGTYIMPSHIHGFGYLDKIREVFVPESGKCENLLPDENQQKRITYLRKPGRVMMRRLGFEKSEEIKAANTVVMTESFDDGLCGWTDYHNVVSAESTGSSVLVKPLTEFQHYSLVKWGGDEGLFDASAATHMKIYVRSPEGDSQIRFAFLTDTDKHWNGSKCETTYTVKKSDEYTVIDFNPGRFLTWKGRITDLRIDNMRKLPFEIAKIEWMIYKDNDGTDPEIYINDVRMPLAFEPISCDGDLVVSLDPGPGYGAFRMLKLYHEFDDASRTLYIATNDTEAYFTVDSAVAVVNGKKVSMTAPMRMRDGLPTFKLGELCGILGYKVELSDKNKMRIFTK